MGFRVSYVLHLVVLFSMMFVSAWSQDDVVMQKLKSSIKSSSNDLDWSDSDFRKWNRVQINGNTVTAIQIAGLNIQGSLPKELVQLTQLNRFECNGNALSGDFPYMPSSLQFLYINNNNFTSMPSDFFTNMSNLIEVSIGYNPFPQWQIPSSLKNCLALKVFSAMNASLVGVIPEFFGKETFPGLTNLYLSFNFLEGNLPNSLSGSSIEKLWVNGQSSINRLNGTLSVLQNLTSLKQIWVHGNSFTGRIPDLSNHDQLFDVSLRDNQLTGVVPPSLTSLQSLTVVNLTNNYLQGSLPKFQNRVRVDNDIDRGTHSFCTKAIGQPCSPLVNALLSVVEPFGYPLKLAQSWQGNDPCQGGWLGVVCSSGNITIIDFQNKGFTGSISPNFASLSSLTKLLLANNNLTGTLPKELASMPQLKELDVSNNLLYGHIPSFRGDVVVKTGGNPDIGKDKPHDSPDSPKSSSDSSSGGEDKKKLSVGAIVGIVIGILCLIGTLVVVFVMCHRRQNKRDDKIETPNAIVVHPRHSGDGNGVKISVAASGSSGAGVSGGTAGFSQSSSVQNVEAGNMVISIQVLREVTGNFSEKNILGRGGFATVYKGELDDGTTIAVKRMKSEMVGDEGLNEIKSEIAVLTKVRHRHLVALHGYCLDDNEKLLVFEYMPQGTLSQHLFEWKDDGLKPLGWKSRLSIALDVARGVEYLHGLAQQIFIHRDLKPTNILLGDDMRAKVADFGLVRLAPEGKASLIQTRFAGTFGYMAPEYAVTGRVTTKLDVYSYGVILMEMITGKRVIDNNQPDENIHLVTWFRRIILNKGSYEKVIDPAMDINEEGLESFRIISELASHCCAREPHQRPDMGYVVNVLAPLVEIWKPAEPNADDMYGIDLYMGLPQAPSKLQNLEGMSNTLDVSYCSSKAASSENTQSSIPPQSPGFVDSFTSSDAR
ncbi:putative transferase, protein kinase RLK-Pelle-LRR-IX family [Medicago truncatula]|uniref:non-specific serine/threonine protein kinase n=1 Tax=Medicago truncatula TaxID=3880 RepID=A0A072VGV1_MEDTR|nr:receptor protein kinase TMK1 [Medicago truncatula]KEH40668.1 receptor kinase TMK1-like protein, putative [Medicago truncatula]RHN78093.1 putative transferase, protein kinase RLK-Pelle-LRR-IX family [Medicago truncatula]